MNERTSAVPPLIVCGQCSATVSADARHCWLCNAAIKQPAASTAEALVIAELVGGSPFGPAKPAPLSNPAAAPADAANIDLTLNISLWILAVVLLVIVVTLLPSNQFVALVVAITSVGAYGILLMTSATSRLSGRPMKAWVKLVTLLTSAMILVPLAIGVVALLMIVSMIIAVWQFCFPNG